MTDRKRQLLLARHLRLHLRLLTLLRQELGAPATMSPSAWQQWLAAREVAVTGLAADGCVSLAADTAGAIRAGDPCSDLLRQLHQGEVRMMAAALACDERLQAACARRLSAMGRRLRGRRRAETTRDRYRAQGSPASRTTD